MNNFCVFKLSFLGQYFTQIKWILISFRFSGRGHQIFISNLPENLWCYPLHPKHELLIFTRPPCLTLNFPGIFLVAKKFVFVSSDNIIAVFVGFYKLHMFTFDIMRYKENIFMACIKNNQLAFIHLCDHQKLLLAA